MFAPYYTLNLSRSQGLKPSASLFAQHSNLTQRTDDLLSRIPDADPLILYIVGHAQPDLFWNEDTPITDDVLKDQIREARSSRKTLIVWDTCYAMSVLTPGASPVDGDDPDLARKSKYFWGRETVHLFSCQSHERTWHQGEKGARVTLFSAQLKDALEGLPKGGKWGWDVLEKGLNGRFGSLQRPQVVYAKDGPIPGDFFG